MTWSPALPVTRARVGYVPTAWSWLILGLGLVLSLSVNALAETEQHFDELQIGTHTYKNVKVTTKARKYVFIVHSGGMSNIKVSELPDDILLKLGYVSSPKVQTNAASLWAKNAVAKIDAKGLKRMQNNLLQAWQKTALGSKMHLPRLSPQLLAAAGVILFILFGFHGYCCKLICEKAETDPGVLVWVPVLQGIPLLRAASMSAWWLAAFFIPVLNLVAYVIWSAKIVQARHKTIPLTILLLLPVTNVLAFLYLAFSEGAPQGKEPVEPHLRIMTLETV